MKRSKKFKITLQERVRILASTEGVVINSDGKRLKPGTPEYLQQLEKFVKHLGEEEFQDFVAHGKVKGQ